MARFFFLIAVLVLAHSTPLRASETITLKAGDGLEVSADVYRTHADAAAPWIVLAHQAGASRGEYLTIAPRLNALGFNAVALDLRSGRSFANVANETAKRAAALGKGTAYLDALPDIRAGIAWARTQTSGPVLLLGSSYSAALSLVLAGSGTKLVDGVLAFSPGEYLKGQSVAKPAAKIKVPALIVTPPGEANRIAPFKRVIPAKLLTSFVPKTGGRHGASSLIPARTANAEAHWSVVARFLAPFAAR